MLEVDPERHERLFIYRRRVRLTIDQLSYQLRVSVITYRRWEEGKLPRTCPDVEVGELSTIEKCILLRRRAKLTQDMVAARMGIASIGVKRMEAGLIRIDDLVKFWRKYQSDQAN